MLAQLGRHDEADLYRKKGELWRRLTGLLERARASGDHHDEGLCSQLAQTCEALGRTPEAAAWYRVVLALDPASADAQQALYRLAGGRNEAVGIGETIPRFSASRGGKFWLHGRESRHGIPHGLGIKFLLLEQRSQR